MSDELNGNGIGDGTPSPSGGGEGIPAVETVFAKYEGETVTFDGSIALEAAGDKPKRFKLTAYTGGKMRPSGIWGDTVVDLAGMNVAAQKIPILFGHDDAKPIGHTDAITKDVANLEAEGVLSIDSGLTKLVRGGSKNGFPWKASIGASIDKAVFIEDGEKGEANGQTFEGPVTIIRASRLSEISIVPIAADRNTSVSIAASKNRRSSEMNKQFQDWLVASGFDKPEDLSDTQIAALKPAYDAHVAATASNNASGDTADDPIVELRARRASELTRCAEIQAIFGGRYPQIEAKAVNEGWDATKAELELLRAERAEAPNSANGRQNPPAPESTDVIQATLCLAAGLHESFVAEQFSKDIVHEALSAKMRGYGLQTLMYDTMRAANQPFRPGIVNDSVIRDTLRADRMLTAASDSSTFSLSGVLSNVANKVLLASYSSVETVLPTICGTRDTRDFKQFSSYRVTTDGLLLELAPDGEIKHTVMQDTTYTNQVKTYARMMTLTRNDMVNDDLGAYLEIPRHFGRNAALTLESTGFTTILANPSSFFHANNNNLLTGAGSVLAIAGLTDAEEAFLDLTDADGKPILVSPRYLLVPTALKVTAQQLMTETRVNELTVENVPMPANNPHAGKWIPLASPYLNSQGLAGQSSTAWYLIANPADIAFAQIAYLQGRRVPVIESSEVDFNKLGMSWRTWFDFGFAMQDTNGAVKSNGA